jgi:MFS family permease
MLRVVIIALVIGNANFEFTLIGGAFTDIAAEFQTTQVALVSTVVFVASLVFLPIAGRMCDVYGKKRILLAVAVVFALGSILCALAPTYWLFLTGRVLQSTFVVAYVAGYGLVRDLLPARLVAMGVGVIGAGTGVAVLVGPLLGGWLIDSYGYRSAFWFELAYDIFAGLLVLFAIPESSTRVKRRIDVTGGLLLGVGVAAVVYGIVEPAALAWALPLGLVLLVTFALLQRRSAEPIVSTALLGRPAVWMTLVAGGFIIAAITAAPVLLSEIARIPFVPGIAEYGLGMSALTYGVVIGLPFGLVSAAAGLLAAWVCRRFAPRTALLLAGLVILVSVVLLLLVTGNVLVAATAAALQGAGVGFLYAAANTLLIEGVPAAEQGISTSLLYTALGVMNAVGTAVVGTIIAAHAIPAPNGSAELLVAESGFRIAFLVLAGSSLVGLGVALAMRHGRRPATGGLREQAPDEAESVGSAV